MQILVLGGTQFIGRHIVEALVAAGHSVTILNRGRTPDLLPASVERLRGDRDNGESGVRALTGRTWDACVDVCGYLPAKVRPSAQCLSRSVKRYVFISAVRVYGDPEDRPVRETHGTIPPAGDGTTEIDNETYGPLKVACENIVREIYGDRGTILRPQIVAGPYDPSGRYNYWVNRSTAPGPMLAPGDGSDHLQVIDARDLARFAVRVIEGDLSGVYNLAGPRITWADFVHLLGAKQPVWVSADILRAEGVTERELPLYRPDRGPWSSLMDVSSEKPQAQGLVVTDPGTTVADTRAWRLQARLPPPLSREREAELIRIARMDADRAAQ